MKVCDLTQFYSPVSGGVKRYLQEKSAYVARRQCEDEHVWIIPGERTGVTRMNQARVYSIKSPLVSRTSRYRFLWRVDLVEEILEREMPDVIESGDPYQMAWKATASARGLGLACVGFYHSHFPEAYVRSFMKFAGQLPTEMLMEFCRMYVRTLYNRFDRTVVPSEALAEVLRDWGVSNVLAIELGVDTECFSPDAERGRGMRKELGIGLDERVLVYVGRLAPEKNVRVLFDAFAQLCAEGWESRLIVVGDGAERRRLEELGAETGRVHWLAYCEDAVRLADIYRAADVFVHPGVQETFGLVTLESQACGTPVVAIRGSYMDRIIFTDLRHLAVANCGEGLATAIKEVWKEDLEALGRVVSLKVREVYSWERVFSRMFMVYREIATGRISEQCKDDS